MADTMTAPTDATTALPITDPNDLIGCFVICRCSAAGVHAGTLVSLNGEDGATLNGSRRLWRWYAKKGDFLSGVAVHGLHDGKSKQSKIGEPVDIAIKGVCEIIPCTDAATASIQEFASHDPN